MKVVVLGAGVVGLCTAYFLAQQGHSVTVVDAHSVVGAGASYANGGQLSYNYVAPLAGPGVIGHLPGWLLDRGSPVRFRLRLDWHQWRWCLSFLLASNSRASQRTTAALLDLSMSSRAELEHLIDNEAMDFSFRRSGKLVVYRARSAFEAARKQATFQQELGCNQIILGPKECVAQEPALAHLGPKLVGGVYSPSDQSGDCHRFCVELARILDTKYQVSFVMSTRVRELTVAGEQVTHALSDTAAVAGDAFVVALGTGSRALLKPLGLSPLLYPLKGYSLSIPIGDASRAPSMSVTDHADRVVYARLGNELRVAGMVDIGVDDVLDDSRVATLRRQASGAFPGAGDFTAGPAWCGFRPATASGMPIVDRSTTLSNLTLNIGHGSLGFTLAMATGLWAAALTNRG